MWSLSSKTWSDRVELKPQSSPWERGFNHVFGGSTSLVLSDPDVAATAGLTDTYPAQRLIIVDYDDVVVYAGLIRRARYVRDTRALSLTHEDIWSLWDARLISEVRDQNIVNWKKTYSGLEYDTIIKRIIQLAVAGSGRNVPMVYEDDYTGGRTRTYYGYNMDTALDAMEEIMDLSDGPDVDFRPEWDGAGGIRFTLRTGDLSLNTIEVNFSAPETPASGLWIETDASEVATQMFAVGEGSGQRTAKSPGMLVRESASSNIADYPALERTEQFKNIKKGDELYEQASSALIANNHAVRQAGFELKLDSPILGNLWELRPGTIVRWYISDDPYFTTGWREWRVLKYSGDITDDFVKIEFQPKGG
ncbi:hypothetical protein [Paeniglutamicibacter terrestris]|uniref:Minor tail protein n=1 Tax=Paeniglutamicibacter terrestris TaxID=2723403 RepID=A0ABX1G910_9MICC|nr:hypothetical protein [Paeniglutamicibacter terrestris]NKG22201.1 hypothetical protein [Paeniglutamicibacter terrestris]